MIIAGVLALAILATGGTLWVSRSVETPLTRHLPAQLQPRAFPSVETAALPPARAHIIERLRVEFAANKPGTSFSEGVQEPWCADFVSTVLRDAGVPVRNPNSGSWRIPGVATLTEYFQHEGRLHPPQYRPLPGDVVLYADERPTLHQHTNVVVAVSGEQVTTVGGNQAGGISVLTYDLADAVGLVGYGSPTA